jgi:hypothetical protein
MDEVIAIQGSEEYTQFINQMKRDNLGINTYTGSDMDFLDKKPKWCLLQTQCEQWQILIDKIDLSHSTMLSKTEIKHWYHISKQCRRNTKIYCVQSNKSDKKNGIILNYTTCGSENMETLQE